MKINSLNKFNKKLTLTEKSFNQSNNLLSKNLENTIFATVPRVPRPVGNPRKRRKFQDENPPIPITFANIFKRKLSRKFRRTKPIKVLVDSGASKSIINKHCILDNKCYKEKQTVWQTAAGDVSTSTKCKLEFGLHEFSTTRRITHDFHVMNQVIPGYDMIIGRDLMHILKLDVIFSTST